jgi:hypothetical protein
VHSSSCHVKQGCFLLISKWRLGAFFILPREAGLLSSNFKMEVGCISGGFKVSSFYSEGGMHNCFYMYVGAFFLMHSSSFQVKVGAFFILPCGNKVHYSSILLQYRWVRFSSLLRGDGEEGRREWEGRV